MENIALTYISASLVGVIVAAAPLFTALIAAVFLKEKLSIWFFCGFVCAMTGITLVSLAGVSELHFSPVGALLTVGAKPLSGAFTRCSSVLGHMGYQTVPLTCRIFSATAFCSCSSRRLSRVFRPASRHGARRCIWRTCCFSACSRPRPAL